MKTFQKVGGISALVCAGTYILAIVLVTTVLAPLADSSLPFDQFIGFYLSHQTLVHIFYLVTYLVNGVFLALLTLALYQRLKPGAPALALVAACFGLLWTGMIFASGFINLYGLEVIGGLASSDPTQASMLWLVVDTVTTGIDHSDRFLGCLWVLLTSWAALRAGQLSKPLNVLGLVIGAVGVLSSVTTALVVLSYAFGIGVIFWWIWLGVIMLRRSPSAAV
ncbi:MAG: DUF4386 family protein [Anaerolineae bacterium]|nr:DUF4386 family protein [Anaerolineae bacterium]